MRINAAFSPCPNDTFTFHAWLHRLIDSPLSLEPLLADVETLNQHALEQRFPLSKISLGLLPHIAEHYTLLPVGTTVGYGCGPKLIAAQPFPLEEFSQKSVAIPGRFTTAHTLLQQLLPPPHQKQFCSYHEICTRIQQGVVDCGLIIHETRFTYQRQGLIEIVDLGKLWEEKYGLPIPLGGIVAAKSLGCELLQQISQALRQSLQYAFAHPTASSDYLLTHSQEKETAIVKQHIDLYVTADTLSLSAEAIKAMQLLCGQTTLPLLSQ